MDMNDDFSKFRTAIGGFNRSDVAAYIENAAIAQKKAVKQLQEQLSAAQGREAELNAENTRLTVELSEAKAAMQAQQEAPPAPAPSSVETPTIEPEPESKPAPAPVPTPAPAPVPAPSESFNERELAAYRRAEAAERAAQARADRLYTQLNDIFENALSKFGESNEEISALYTDLSDNLQRIRDALADLHQSFDETGAALRAVERPNEEADESV